MSEPKPRGAQSGEVLAVVRWALVLLPLLWGIYQTSTGVVALFS